MMTFILLIIIIQNQIQENEPQNITDKFLQNRNHTCREYCTEQYTKKYQLYEFKRAKIQLAKNTSKTATTRTAVAFAKLAVLRAH